MASMHAIHRQAVPPTGVSHVVSARLTPSCLQEASTSRSKIIRNLVTARNNFVQVYEIREEYGSAAERHASSDDIKDAIDEDEKPTINGHAVDIEEQSKPQAKLVFVREHHAHGVVTGLQRVQTIETEKDGLDRILISFKDAKVALMEWSAELHDLVPVSLHTFERLPQFSQDSATSYVLLLRTDPMSRCAALLLPQDTLAITPFFNEQIELEGIDTADMQSLPYAPSFTLDLREISADLHNITDFVFLPGFNEPTMALLAEPQQTWTGRLENRKDTMNLFFVTLDVTSTPPMSTVISSTPSLPFDCQNVTACPRDTGGVLVTTPNSILHLDQSGKRTAIAVNDWANGLTDLNRAENDRKTDPLALEGYGRCVALRLQRDGRTVSKLSIMPDTLMQNSPACCVELVRSHLTARTEHDTHRACYVFLGSIISDSHLSRLDIDRVSLDGETHLLTNGMATASPAKQEDPADMDEDDIDIYGSAEIKASVLSAENSARIAANTRTEICMTVTDTLYSYGSLRGGVIGTLNEEAPPELVVCNGDEQSGGLTILHRSILPTNRKTLQLDHPTEHIWHVKLLTGTGDRFYFVTSADRETQIYALAEDLKLPEHLKTYGKTTLLAAATDDGAYLVHIRSDAIAVLKPNLTEVQSLKLPRDDLAKDACMTGGYILLTRVSGSHSLHFVHSGSAKIDEVPLPRAAIDAGCATLFADNDRLHTAGRLAAETKSEGMETDQVNREPPPAVAAEADYMDAEEDNLYTDNVAPKAATSNVRATAQQHALIALEYDTCLAYIAKDGSFTITAIPSMQTIYSQKDIIDLRSSLSDRAEQQAVELEGEQPTVEQVKLAYVGTVTKKMFCIFMLSDGTMATYEAVADATSRSHEHDSLGIRLVKISSLSLGTSRFKPRGTGAADLGKAARRLLDFTDLDGHSGVMLSGDAPMWLLGEDATATRWYDCTAKPVYGFASINHPQYPRGCLLSLGEHTELGNFPPALRLGRQVAFTKVVEGRLFESIDFDPQTQTYAALSAFTAPFEIFDEQGEAISKTPHDAFAPATYYTSALELIEPGTWATVDGYEFRQYEQATCLSIVQMSTDAEPSGYKTVVAVGTAIARGEDLASKGALYAFEIVTAQAELEEETPRRKLRLLFQEDVRSAVTTLAGLDGYLLHTVGLKVYAKVLMQDERLLATGFMDVGMNTTTIRTLKNLILLGDAKDGLNFVGFQEDPYKIVTLAKEVKPSHVVTADFLVLENRTLFITTDRLGTMRFFEFDPMQRDAQAGHLVARVEYNIGSEVMQTVVFQRNAGADAKQSGILFLHEDGSLSTVLPVKDAVYKRLQLLERQLVRHTQHFAALHPRAYRAVRNDFAQRPLLKGILDGDLLNAYGMLSRSRQQDLADPLGSDSDTINYNIASLRAPW